MSLNCFENISVHIDVSSGSNSTPNGYKVFKKKNVLIILMYYLIFTLYIYRLLSMCKN